MYTSREYEIDVSNLDQLLLIIKTDSHFAMDSHILTFDPYFSPRITASIIISLVR